MGRIILEFHIPKWVADGLAAGEFVLHGGVIYRRTGGVAHHLRGGEDILSFLNGKPVPQSWQHLVINTFAVAQTTVMCLQIAQLNETMVRVENKIDFIVAATKRTERKTDALVLGAAAGICENIRLAFSDDKLPAIREIRGLRNRMVEVAAQIHWYIKTLTEDDFKREPQNCAEYKSLLLLCAQQIAFLSMLLEETGAAKQYSQMHSGSLSQFVKQWEQLTSSIANISWLKPEHHLAIAVLRKNLQLADMRALEFCNSIALLKESDITISVLPAEPHF
jgi:hypothetical protein